MLKPKTVVEIDVRGGKSLTLYEFGMRESSLINAEPREIAEETQEFFSSQMKNESYL